MFGENYKKAYDQICINRLDVQELIQRAEEGRYLGGKMFCRIRPIAVSILSVCLMFMLVLPVVAEEIPAVYRVVCKYAPVLADYILPEEMVCTRQDITMQVEAVNVSDKQAEILLSFRDAEEGVRNRIRGKVDLYESYRISNYGERSVIGGCSFLEYDSEEDKAYFKIDITSDKIYPETKIKFTVEQLLTNCVEEDRRISLDGMDYEPKEKIVEINGAGGKLRGDNGGPFSVKNSESYRFPNRMVCVMDEVELSEDMTESLQITGIAYDEGILRVQQCRGNFRYADRHVRLYLRNQDALEKIPDGSVSWQEVIEGERVLFDEVWFAISEEELEQCELYGTFCITDGSVQGDWEVVVELGNK